MLPWKEPPPSATASRARQGFRDVGAGKLIEPSAALMDGPPRRAPPRGECVDVARRALASSCEPKTRANEAYPRSVRQSERQRSSPSPLTERDDDRGGGVSRSLSYFALV
ncbi:hypothetical protein MRX96_055639 [Rhipicephalus microplus]